MPYGGNTSFNQSIMIIEIFSRVLALVLIIILLPLIFIIITLIYFLQGSPIIFKQSRVGYKFKKFKIYKFRTMSINSGSKITKFNDDRLTRLGALLRKTKLDELPQLFNIIRGEMRFIGPRPEVREYFSAHNFNYLESIKPGISDYSSIIFRNEDRILNTIGGDNPYERLLPLKIILANYYSKRKTFFLDFKLVIITIIAIVMPNYASKKLIIPNLIIDLPQIESFLDEFEI